MVCLQRGHLRIILPPLSWDGASPPLFCQLLLLLKSSFLVFLSLLLLPLLVLLPSLLLPLFLQALLPPLRAQPRLSLFLPLAFLLPLLLQQVPSLLVPLSFHKPGVFFRGPFFRRLFKNFHLPFFLFLFHFDSG